MVPSINREFGTVTLNNQNVAYDVVSDGWAKVTFFCCFEQVFQIKYVLCVREALGFSEYSVLFS